MKTNMKTAKYILVAVLISAAAGLVGYFAARNADMRTAEYGEVQP